jgi:hypothetical protein
MRLRPEGPAAWRGLRGDALAAGLAVPAPARVAVPLPRAGRQNWLAGQ